MLEGFRRLFSLFSVCIVGGGLALAGTVTSIDALTPGEDGVYTIQESAVYLISAADLTGVTKEYTLTTAGNFVNAALQIRLGDQNNTIILRLSAYRSLIDGLQDENGNYVPAIKVTGTGTLIIRHENTAKSVYLRIKDKAGGEQPTIDLSGMRGGEVRFERAVGESGTTGFWIQRAWADSMAATSAGNKPAPLVIGNTKVRLTFAEGARVRFQASPCVVKSSSLYVLPELISEGYASMRIEGDAVVCVYSYMASQSARNAGYSWTAKSLFPAPIALANGSLEVENSAATTTNTIDIYPSQKEEVIAMVRGCGEVFGKKILMVSTKSGVVPEACFKIAEGQTLSETERMADENGRLVIEADKSPELVYAPSVSASNQEAVTLFDLLPTVTENGCTVRKDFGIADIKVGKKSDNSFVLTFKVSVALPTEIASTRSFYLRIIQTAPDGAVSTIYPSSGTAALTTFTRDTTESSSFSAFISRPLTTSMGTTFFVVRAYSTPPFE